jgi:carbon starvation protein
MNSLVVSVVVLVLFGLAYKIYGGYLTRWIVQPDDSRPTPAYQCRDNVDFCPASRPFVWSNHFASIAGAGPIIGPILAVSFFGWGPAVLWVTFGTIFIGGVHDYLSLMISVQHQGKGLAELSETLAGGFIKNIMGILIFIFLLLIIAVFMVSVAQAFMKMPSLVIPTLGLIGLAILMGAAITSFDLNAAIVSIVGVVVAYVLIWVGLKVPVILPSALDPKTIRAIWCLVLAVYCYFASISPMWLILRPRDMVSAVMLTVGMILAVMGIVVVHPDLTAPFYTGGFVMQGRPLWPMLFVIIACGAISGFHSLVSTGTSARQLSKESHGKAVGYGAMVVEGCVALITIMLVAGGLKWGLAPADVPHAEIDAYFGSALRNSWIIAFASGYGEVVSKMGIPFLTLSLASLLGAVMVKSFILTTLDTCTRLSRFVVTGAFSKYSSQLKNRHLATLIALAPAYYLGVTEGYVAIWKLFGASNQLIAAVALIIITSFLVRAKKPRMFTFINWFKPLPLVVVR